jgi:hypothetical protein
MAKHHGMYRTPTYRSWAEMKYRCGDVNRKSYAKISYCERWEDFRLFFQDMGTRPEGMTLDRIDNSKGYSKQNCRWATHKIQANNRSNNRRFQFNNKSLTLTEWSVITGIRRSTLAQRIYVYGWSIERSLTEGRNLGK